MGFTWVAADVSYFAVVDAGQPDFMPRHRKPALPARAALVASCLPRTLLTRNGQVTPAGGPAAPAEAAAVLVNSSRARHRGTGAQAARSSRLMARPIRMG
jgi:hypothetical protein